MSETPRGDLEFGTIPGMMAKQAEAHGARAAVVDGEVSLTYAELHEQVRQARKAYMAAGVEKGDRVAIWAPNLWEWMVVAMGAHAAGAVVVPVNTRYKGIEAAFLLKKSGAKVLLTVTEFLDTDYVQLLRDATTPDELPELSKIVVIRGAAPDGTETLSQFLEGGASVSDADADVRTDSIGSDDLADILFTSGTTGEPKGAMCTHAQNLRAFRSWSHIVGLSPGDRYLVVMPFFHSFGYKAGWLSALMHGCTVYPEAVFSVDVVLDRVQQDQISVLPGPPALYQSILMHPKRGEFDISSLRLAVTGAASIPVELIEKMRDDLQFDTVITAYGLTESTGVVTMCRQGDAPETIAQTSGRAIPDVEVRIVDSENNPVPTGEPGEIVLRGFNVMQGYFGAPEQTKKAVDSDGWLHTGDVGTLDEAGNIRITDRMKDMFIVGGFNAYPAEIENILLRYDGVGEVAVIGVPHDRLGEVGMAFIVAAPGESVDPDAVMKWSRDNMANFKVPRFVKVVDALPRNPTGKVQKFKLRDMVAEGA